MYIYILCVLFLLLWGNVQSWRTEEQRAHTQHDNNKIANSVTVSLALGKFNLNFYITGNLSFINALQFMFVSTLILNRHSERTCTLTHTGGTFYSDIGYGGSVERQKTERAIWFRDTNKYVFITIYISVLNLKSFFLLSLLLLVYRAECATSRDEKAS